VSRSTSKLGHERLRGDLFSWLTTEAALDESVDRAEVTVEGDLELVRVLQRGANRLGVADQLNPTPDSMSRGASLQDIPLTQSFEPQAVSLSPLTVKST
jgi:hypothetical protein